MCSDIVFSYAVQSSVLRNGEYMTTITPNTNRDYIDAIVNEYKETLDINKVFDNVYEIVYASCRHPISINDVKFELISQLIDMVTEDFNNNLGLAYTSEIGEQLFHYIRDNHPYFVMESI